MTDKLTELVEKWRDKADHIETYGGGLSSMAEDFWCAVQLRDCANQLEKAIKEGTSD